MPFADYSPPDRFSLTQLRGVEAGASGFIAFSKLELGNEELGLSRRGRRKVLLQERVVDGSWSMAL
jgi:hypothetical protein